MLGRDKYMRPILLLRPGRLCAKGFKVNKEDLLVMITYVFFYVKQCMHHPGKIENFVFLFDTEKRGLMSLPVSLLRGFAETLQLNFRCHSCKVIVLNGTSPQVWLWKKVQGKFPEAVRKKVQISGENTCDDLKELVFKSQLPKEYGGTARPQNPNWPPILPPLGPGEKFELHNEEYENSMMNKSQM